MDNKPLDRACASVLYAALFCLIIGFISLRFNIDHDQRNFEAAQYWENKYHADATYDLVVLGDSRVQTSISPVAMRGVLGNWRILNFGFSAAGVSSDYLSAAEGKLDPSSTKKTIILGITPHFLSKDGAANYNFRSVYPERSSTSLFRLLIGARRRVFRPVSLEALLWPEAGNDGFFGLNVQYHESGWLAVYQFAEQPHRDSGLVRESLAKMPVESSYVKQLMEQVKRWTSSGITVIGFRPPPSTEYAKIEDSATGFDEKLIMQEFSNAGGTWLNFSPGKYFTYDGVHYSFSSAVQLSRNLAERILR